jgi:putative flippase GtrA
MLPTWVEGLGLTVPQLIGFVLTIVASYFAARFGAFESRRQHREKVRLETLTAAGEAIQLLHKFARRLEGAGSGP